MNAVNRVNSPSQFEETNLDTNTVTPVDERTSKLFIDVLKCPPALESICKSFSALHVLSSLNNREIHSFITRDKNVDFQRRLFPFLEKGIEVADKIRGRMNRARAFSCIALRVANYDHPQAKNILLTAIETAYYRRNRNKYVDPIGCNLSKENWSFAKDRPDDALELAEMFYAERDRILSKYYIAHHMLEKFPERARSLLQELAKHDSRDFGQYFVYSQFLEDFSIVDLDGALAKASEVRFDKPEAFLLGAIASKQPKERAIPILEMGVRKASTMFEGPKKHFTLSKLVHVYAEFESAAAKNTLNLIPEGTTVNLHAQLPFLASYEATQREAFIEQVKQIEEPEDRIRVLINSGRVLIHSHSESALEILLEANNQMETADLGYRFLDDFATLLPKLDLQIALQKSEDDEYKLLIIASQISPIDPHITEEILDYVKEILDTKDRSGLAHDDRLSLAEICARVDPEKSKRFFSEAIRLVELNSEDEGDRDTQEKFLSVVASLADVNLEPFPPPTQNRETYRIVRSFYKAQIEMAKEIEDVSKRSQRVSDLAMRQAAFDPNEGLQTCQIIEDEHIRTSTSASILSMIPSEESSSSSRPQKRQKG